MLALRQDMLHGFQMLLKKHGFTAAAALSLALGIGANTIIFSLINGTLLKPLAFPDPDRLMVVWTTPLDHPDQRNNVNVSTFFAVRDRNRFVVRESDTDPAELAYIDSGPGPWRGLLGRREGVPPGEPEYYAKLPG